MQMDALSNMQPQPLACDGATNTLVLSMNNPCNEAHHFSGESIHHLAKWFGAVQSFSL
jgi:hypothetical protein